MRKFLFLLCSCALFFGHPSLAQSSNVNKKETAEGLPPMILSGLEAYKDKGPEEAVRAWIKDSPIDGSKDALSQSNTLRQIQDFYGAYQAFEVISTRELTPRIRAIYLALDFEKGPLFAKFLVYRSNQQWILTSFNFNTKEELILPAPR
jgi:hypothetical protein